ncbi:MAG: EAL domain-containing protein [Spirochaetota bacterium]
MDTLKKAVLDIKQIIDNSLIETHFQPLVSLRKKTVIGYEALSRGIDPLTGALIPPLELFDAARQKKLVPELDRLCRKKAVSSYSPVYRDNPDLLLSINFDISILDDTTVGSNMLLELVSQYDIDPGSIMIEIVESCNSSTGVLKTFVQNYRENGFLIALDDMGQSNSNWDRIFSIAPQVIKIDRSLVLDVSRSFYKQELVRSLVNLGHKTGAVIVAEGIENGEDAAGILELGVDVLQGFFFSEPVMPGEIPVDQVYTRIEEQARNFKDHMLHRVQQKKDTFRFLDHITAEIKNELSSCYGNELDSMLAELLPAYNEIHCGYILDSNGIQVTDTVVNPGFSVVTSNRLFRPAEKGEDLSFKDYFYFINAGMLKYTTGPYISTASGELCTTLSTSFTAIDGERYILCIDYHTEY